MQTKLIIDGGTTNLRVYLLDASNEQILCSRKMDGGVRHTAEDGNNRRLISLLQQAVRAVLSDPSAAGADVESCTAYGMITSGLGLVEIPHLPAPVCADDLAQGMKACLFPEICTIPMDFIPGVRNFAGSVDAGNCSGMDMMRGEETEAIGLWQLLQPGGEAVFVLPGSHNKFVHMSKDGYILGCMTSISGELLDVISHHTILSDAVGHSFLSADDYDRDMIRAGALESASSGLGRAAFAGRILNTLGTADKESIQNWLLGAVLAEDVRAMRSFTQNAAAAVYVAGKDPVQGAFLDVMDVLEFPGAQAVDAAVSTHMGIAGAIAISSLRHSADA